MSWPHEKAQKGVEAFANPPQMTAELLIFHKRIGNALTSRINASSALYEHWTLVRVGCQDFHCFQFRLDKIVKIILKMWAFKNTNPKMQPEKEQCDTEWERRDAINNNSIE